MSEEEIIKKVKDEIREYSEISNMFSEFPNKTKEDCDKCVEALQGLLDLYNKEKEKNKELFEEYNKRVATIIKYEQGINEIIDKIYEEYTDISEVVEDLEKLLKRE